MQLLTRCEGSAQRRLPEVVQQFAEERTGATEARGRGQATVWESPKPEGGQRRGEDRVARRGVPSNEDRRRIRPFGAKRSTSGARLPSLKAKRQ